MALIMTFYRATVNNLGAMLIIYSRGVEELRDTGKEEKFSAENHNNIERYKCNIPYYLFSRENNSYSKMKSDA